MATEYLGVKQVAERLGITSGGLLNLKLPEPDAMIGRTRGWLPETIDGWNAKRPGRGVGGGRPRKKQVTGIRGWLRTNGLRFWRPPLYVWCASSGIAAFGTTAAATEIVCASTLTTVRAVR